MDKAMEDFVDIARRLVVKAYNSGIITGAKAEKEKNAYCDEARECAYEDGLVNAWDCARDILTMEQEEFDSIFDEMDRWDTIEKHTPTECINAIKEYREKKAKEEIQVGDEVVYENRRAIVTFISDGWMSAIDIDDGTAHNGLPKYKGYKKTGRNFKQIADVLKAIRGENNA